MLFVQHKRDMIRAFTLIEVLTIVFIMAILSGAVVPMWSKLRLHVLFMNQTDKLQNFLYNAKRTAISSSQPVIITWDPTNNVFQMSGEQYPPDPDQPVALQDQSTQSSTVPSLTNPIGAQTPTTITDSFNLQPGFQVSNFQVDTSSSFDQSYTSGNSNQMTFFPDGSAINTQFTFGTQDGYAATFLIRAGSGNVDVTQGGGSGL